MVMDKRFAELQEIFRISTPDDWTRVRPDQLLAIPNVGPQTLNHLRLHLANRGLTLQNDETPLHWQANLSIGRGTTRIAASEKTVTTNFTILIDKAEKHPFTFAGLLSDAHQGNRPLIVQQRFEHLGPTHGDYTVEGIEDQVSIERKSLQDIQSTVLGWGDRREQFLRTLEYLASIPSSALMIETNLDTAVREMQARGKKSLAENRKIFFRQVMAWMDDFRVPWVWCGERRWAEVATFRWLQREWRHHQAEMKKAEAAASKIEVDLTGI